MRADQGVSVVVPVWDDYVEYLAEAIGSVRSQAPDVPIVIVDNASTAPVPELGGCELVRAPARVSTGEARNLGLERVQTEYVVLLDADDLLLDRALDILLEGIRANPAPVVFAMSIVDGETGERHSTPRAFVPALARRRRLFALLNSIWSLYPLQGCAIVRAADARAAGGYADSDWGEDWVLGASLAARGRVVVDSRVGLTYRPTSGSLWRRPRASAELRASAGRVRQRLRDDAGVPGWMRVLLPLVALLQLAAVYVARPAFLVLRGSD
ncbi:MAG: glycosyltransferase family 2 protein [Solirubrobacterales bacterium]